MMKFYFYGFIRTCFKTNSQLFLISLTAKIRAHWKSDIKTHLILALVSKLDFYEPLTDVLSPTSMRSCLVFSQATVDHSGKYVCHVHEGIQDQSASASVNITVLGKIKPPLHTPSLSPTFLPHTHIDIDTKVKQTDAVQIIITFCWHRKDCLLCQPLDVTVGEELLLKEMKITSLCFSSKCEINFWHGVDPSSDTLRNRAVNQWVQQYLDSQCLCNWGLTSNVNIQWVSILAAKVSGIHHMVLLLMLCLLTVTACRIGQLMLIPPAPRCVIFIQAPSSMFSRDRRPGQFNGGHWTSQWKRCIVSDHRGSRM